MEALILSSRSINQDKLFRKRQDNRYEKHIRQLQIIQNERLSKFNDWDREVKNISSSLRKAKSAAKIFLQKEDLKSKKTENLHLFKRILSLEPSIKLNSSDKFQYVGSNKWTTHKKRLQEKLKEENKSIVQKIMMEQLEVKDYRKKLKEEIKDYIERRNSIRKFKPQQNNKSKRSISQKHHHSQFKPKRIQNNIQSLQKQKFKNLLQKISSEVPETNQIQKSHC